MTYDGDGDDGCNGLFDADVPSSYDIIKDIECSLDGTVEETDGATDAASALLSILATMMVEDPHALTLLLARVHYPDMSYEQLAEICGFSRAWQHEVASGINKVGGRAVSSILRTNTNKANSQQERRRNEKKGE